MNQWLTDNFPLVVSAMAITGGAVAHIRAYEKSEIKLTWKQHVWGLIRRFCYAGFSGLIVYFMSVEYAWSLPMTCIMAGVVGMFGAEFLEFLWELLRNTLRTYVNRGGENKP